MAFYLWNMALFQILIVYTGRGGKKRIQELTDKYNLLNLIRF